KLEACLTNGQSINLDHVIPHRFGHRLIRIAQILQSDLLDKETLGNQLSIFAVAGLNCQTRNENETIAFYNALITHGKRQEKEDDTLEMRVAAVLADLRRQLLQKLIREEDRKIEPLHKVTFLENRHGKKLGLFNPQEY